MAQTTNGNADYTTPINAMLRETMNQWWENLTKEQILAYLAEQPDITADHLRQILANEDFVMSFGVSFATSSHHAEVDFRTA